MGYMVDGMDKWSHIRIQNGNQGNILSFLSLSLSLSFVSFNFNLIYMHASTLQFWFWTSVTLIFFLMPQISGWEHETIDFVLHPIQNTTSREIPA